MNIFSLTASILGWVLSLMLPVSTPQPPTPKPNPVELVAPEGSALDDGSSDAPSANTLTSTTTAIPLKFNQWRLYYHSSFVTVHRPTQMTNGGLSFNFLTATPTKNDFDTYLITPYTKPISGTLKATFSVVTTGTPVFNWKSEVNNTCDTVPATTRLYFQTSTLWNSNEVTRWWANPTSYKFVSQGGTVTLSVPLTPDKWSDTFGHFGTYNAATLKGFANTLLHPTFVGFTMGGGCFFGHGVNVSGGTAQFQLTNYSVVTN